MKFVLPAIYLSLVFTHVSAQNADTHAGLHRIKYRNALMLGLMNYFSPVYLIFLLLVLLYNFVAEAIGGKPGDPG